MGKKSTFSLLLLLLFVYFVPAQQNQWTWVSGDNTFYPDPVYGTKGVPAPGNKPGALLFAVSWTDPSNNLWLFGGFGVGFNMLNLWKYTPSTGLWTWINGDGTSHFLDRSGVYGTKGIAAAGNVPTARGGGVSWTDTNGNLWLFGGGM